MAFVYCNNCNWCQDDFWSETYNPLDYLAGWKFILLESDLDKSFAGENCMDPDTRHEDGSSKTRRDILAEQCERAAHHIRRMKWRTEEEFKNDSDPCCPECGSKDLGVD